MIKSGLRAVLQRSTFVYFPTKILPAIVGLVSFPILTRWFAPDIYGQYAYIQALVALIGNLGGGWLFQSILRFYKGETDSGEWRTFLSKGIVTGSLLFLIWMILFFQFPEGYSEYRLPAGLFILLYIPFRSLTTMDRVEHRPLRYTVFDTSLTGGKFVLAIFLIWITGKNLGLASIFDSGNVIMLCAVIYLFRSKRQNSSQPKNPSDTVSLKRLLRYGFPLALAQVAVWLFGMSDIVLLKYLLNDHAVGVFATLNGVLEKSVRIAPVSIMLVAWPALVSIHRKDGWESAIKEQFFQVRIYLTIMIPVAIGVIIFGGWGYRILIDELYWDGIVLIPYLTVAFVFSGLAQYYLNIFNLAEKSYLVTIGFLVAGSLKVLLSVILVIQYGIVGAAWATLIAFMVLAVWAMAYSHKQFGARFPWQKS
jgi:O-antigen/teichoic acid export membrane protein